MNELTAEMNEQAPQKDVKCKNHPEALATKPCERCGDFICSDCPTFSGLGGCPACIIEIYCASPFFKKYCRNTAALASLNTFVVAAIFVGVFYIFDLRPKIDVPAAVASVLLLVPLAWMCAKGTIQNVIPRLELAGDKIVLQGELKMSCHTPPSMFLAFVVAAAFFAGAELMGPIPEPIATSFLIFIFLWICLLFAGATTVNRLELFQLDSDEN